MVPPARPSARHSVHCTLVAVDMSGFGDLRRNSEDQAYLRRSLYELLIESFETCGVPWGACAHEDRGDGVLIVVSSAIPTGLFVDEVPARLAALLRRHNRWSSDLVKIKLRMAVHAGHVHFDGHGMTGHALVHLFRLLEAPEFKRYFGASRADLGLTVSGYLYDEVIRHGQAGIDHTAFVPLPVELKETSADSWVRVSPEPLADLSFADMAIGEATPSRDTARHETSLS